MRFPTILAAWLALASGARAEAHVERFTLPNGLRVVLAPDFHATRAVMLVRYAVGSRDNPKGYRGLAHLTEHLTFAQLDALAELEKLGATEIQGTTSQDETTYYAYLPRRALEGALWLEASRMAFQIDRLNERELEGVEEVVVAEWRENRHDSGMSLGELELVRSLYPETHPYHRRGDDPDDVRAIKLHDVQWFAQQYYTPQRAALVVIGAFDAAEVRGWVERYFGAVRASGAAAPRFTQQAPAPLRQSCVIDVPASAVDEGLVATWLGPPRGSDDELVLQVIDTLLDGHPGAPLRQLMQSDPEIAEVAIGHVHLELAHEIRIGIDGRAPIEAEKLVPRLDAVLTALRSGRLNSGVPRAVAGAIERAERSWDSLDELAQLLADTNQPPLDQQLVRLAKVRAEDVVRVARKWLDPQRRVLSYITGRHAEQAGVHVECEPTP